MHLPHQLRPSKVTITDYPSASILSAIQDNVDRNTPKRTFAKVSNSSFREGNAVHRERSQVTAFAQEPSTRGELDVEVEVEVEVLGHEWGTIPAFTATTSSSTVAANEADNDDDGSTKDVDPHKETQSRIILTDTLWLPHQHAALLDSVRYFLQPPSSLPSLGSHAERSFEGIQGADEQVGEGGKVFLIAGYHTGQSHIQAFLDAVEASPPLAFTIPPSLSFSQPNTTTSVLSEAESKSNSNPESPLRWQLHVEDMWEINTDFEARECAWWRRPPSSSSSAPPFFNGDRDQKVNTQTWGGDRERWMVCAVLGYRSISF